MKSKYLRLSLSILNCIHPTWRKVDIKGFQYKFSSVVTPPKKK